MLKIKGLREAFVRTYARLTTCSPDTQPFRATESKAIRFAATSPLGQSSKLTPKTEDTDCSQLI